MYRQRLRLSALIAAVIALALAATLLLGAHEQVTAQGINCQTFTQTGKTVCGRFLTYWQGHGALAQQGYPVSVGFDEVSDVDGKTYRVQYFERAVFECKCPELG